MIRTGAVITLYLIFVKGTIMKIKLKNHPRNMGLWALGLLFVSFTVASYAEGYSVIGWGGGNYHSHGGYGYGRGGGYYDRGGFFFGGGWGGPNVIINVPSAPYYAPPPIVCENVEVCNPYDECWLERRCG